MLSTLAQSVVVTFGFMQNYFLAMFSTTVKMYGVISELQKVLKFKVSLTVYNNILYFI